MFFAALALLPLLLIRGDSLRVERSTLFLLIGCGIFLGIDFMFWHRSIGLIGPGLSTLLGNFQVFFTALLSWLLLREKITFLFGLALLLAIGGLLLITGTDLAALSQVTRVGILFGLATAVFYSAYIMLIKQAMSSGSAGGVTTMFWVSVSCFLFMALVSLGKGVSFTLPDSRALLFLAGVGIISTALGWSMLSSAIRVVPATLAGLVLLLQPTLAFFWDVLLFQRPTGGLEYLGIGLILTAIYLGSYRRRH
jgi:drug/metabolite transporter (DMT)-like permease